MKLGDERIKTHDSPVPLLLWIAPAPLAVRIYGDDSFYALTLVSCHTTTAANWNGTHPDTKFSGRHSNSQWKGRPGALAGARPRRGPMYVFQQCTYVRTYVRVSIKKAWLRSQMLKFYARIVYLI